MSLLVRAAVAPIKLGILQGRSPSSVSETTTVAVALTKGLI